MDDKIIRSVLIEYLKTNNSEIRIYQEKSIGSSICDLLAVTDCLTGYEIKSDRDNYSRLETQVRAYRYFFDKNYIVVGESHRNTVASKIPDVWGIIVVEKTGISIEREAKAEGYPFPSRRDQLGILWKLELKNLLTKTNLPLYTYKSKDYIISQIVEHISDSEIQRHIVYELLHRDYSRYNATDYSIYFSEESNTKLTNNLPVGEIVDILSENDLEEFTLDKWISLYRQAKEVQTTKQTIYYNKTTERIQHQITYQDIEVSPGVPWVSEKIISDFVYFLKKGKDNQHIYAGYVNYEPITGYWFIPDKKDKSNCDVQRIYYTYGIDDYNALYILEATLNLREIKLFDNNNKYDEKATIAALDKQDAIIRLFKEWIWKDEDRRWEIEESYNQLFGKYTTQKYDGSKLEFPEMSPKINLYSYQKDAIQRIISEKNTLLAFDVGAGKTYIMIAAAMKLRFDGISRKNMFVVPNNIVGQWELIFKKMYPQSKLLTIEPKSFKPEMRQKVLNQIKTSDYDGIIISYSCFEMIPLSGKSIMIQLNNKLSEINQAVRKMGYEVGTRTALKREAEYLKKLTGELMGTLYETTNEITFDQLEINSLFVDEAHNFKNIPLRTNLHNIAGINIKGSKKCLEMLHKVQAIQDANNGRGVIFATGTPLCNSISDTYAMQMYLQQDELKKIHLDRFDNWIKTFAKPEMVCEIDVDTSKYRFVNRFSRFFNLPELSKMFASIAVFHSMKDEDGLPECEEYEDIIIPHNERLQAYMNDICERTEKIRAKEVDKRMDNMLKISTDGRKAALDLRLVGKEQPYDEYSKLYQCVRNVMQIYQEYPGCAQIVFCDYSTPRVDEFNIYTELKNHFIEMGVSKQEIAFIHSYHSEAKKVALYERVNQGEVRILIGSTFKLGIGANVQTKLKAVHHLDVPWRPADMVQREGRIVRKGNENKKVNIFRYICKGSFDSYSWQILETKQRFISQFLKGSSYQRSASDLEENILTYAQVKALAISNPKIKIIAEKENKLSRIRILSEEYALSHKRVKERNAKLTEEIASLKKRQKITQSNAHYVNELSPNAINAEYLRIKTVITDGFGFSPLRDALFFLEFEINVPETQESNKPYVFLKRSDEKYRVEIGKSPVGNARRIVNAVKKLPELYLEYDRQINDKKSMIAQNKKLLNEINPYIDQIKELSIQLAEIRGNQNSDWQLTANG